VTPTASILSDFWNDQLVAHDRQAVFLVLVGFLVAFGFIRFSARLGRSQRAPWWPGSVVSDSGVHLHHLVWGICLMLAAGALGFATFDAPGWRELCALMFGIGAGFTIDEFALWVYLDDVYWAEEGRASIDAAVVAAVILLLVLVGARPFTINGNRPGDVIIAVLVIGLLLFSVIVCFAKYRIMHGTFGLFVWPIAIYGAVRIAKPRSTWAKRFYAGRNPRKQAKAERRFPPGRRTDLFKERFRDAIGGQTDAVYRAKLAEQSATLQAASEMQHRAERVSEAERTPGVR
jgi:hypothetical protein